MRDGILLLLVLLGPMEACSTGLEALEREASREIEEKAAHEREGRCGAGTSGASKASRIVVQSGIVYAGDRGEAADEAARSRDREKAASHSKAGCRSNRGWHWTFDARKGTRGGSDQHGSTVVSTLGVEESVWHGLRMNSIGRVHG